MLIAANATRLTQLNRTYSGTTSVAGGHRRESIGRQTGSRRNFYAGWGTVIGGAGIASTASVPNGHEHPGAWMMAPAGGGLAAYNTISGSADLAASIALGRALSAELTASGTISAASLALIVSFAADLAGDGDLSAAMRGAVQLAAELAGDGDVSAALGLIAWCACDLAGTGTASGSTLRGTASMAAEILSYGALTPEGIRDAVWNALAASFNDAGTMGELLNGAGGGTTPAAIADGILARNLAGGSDGGRTVRDALRVGRNRVEIVGTTLTVYAEDDTTPAWTATISTGTRDPLQGVDPA